MGLIEFFFPKERIITLDIGSRYTKAAQFYFQGKKPIFTQFEMISTPPQCFERGALLPESGINQVLSDLLKKKLKLTPIKKLLVAMQGNHIFTKDIQTPNYEKEMLNEYIKFEASQYLPYDLNEVSYDYEELNCFKDSESKHFIFVAINKKNLNVYKSSLTDSGLKMHSIDTSFFCLEQIFAKNIPKKSITSDENILILNIGYQTTGFQILRGNQTIFSRYFTIGLESYVEEIQNQVGLTKKEAQSLLTSACTEKQIPDEITKVIRNYHSLFSREVCMGLEYFLNYLPQERISKCFVTGGGSTLLGFQKEFSRRIEADVEILPIFRNIQTKGFSKKKLAGIQSFAGVCVGLALRYGQKNKK